MKPEQLLQADYLDIIYQRHNKLYGGYELRNHYGQRLGKAGAVFFLLLGLLVAVSFLGAHTAIRHLVVDTPIVMADVHVDPAAIKPPVIPPPPSAPRQATTTAPVITPPTVVEDEMVDPGIKPVENAKAGEGKPGTENVAGATIGVTATTATGTAKAVISTPLPGPAAPVSWAPIMPQFTGNLHDYMASHIRYPEVAKAQNISGRVVIEFVVNEDGAISNVVVKRGIGGGCDEEAVRMVSGMPRWKPGNQNGHPVKILFTLPITFVLQ